MSPIDRVATIAERFLSERTFTLIVAPALADFEYERSHRAGMSECVPVACALISAAYEDLTSDITSVLTFAALGLMPACYYLFMFLLCAPGLVHRRGAESVSLGFLALVFSISALLPVVCYWPAARPRRREAEGS